MSSDTQRLYVILLGRPADQEGLSDALEIATDAAFLSNGSTLGETDEIFERMLTERISNSLEFEVRFAGMTSQEVVKEFYSSMFNREPSETALQFWSQSLDAGDYTIATLGITLANHSTTGRDASALANKCLAADLFTRAIDTPRETGAYVGPEGIMAGSIFLDPVSPTSGIPSTANIDALLERLATDVLGPISAVFHFKASDGFDYLDGSSVETEEAQIIGVDFYADQHPEYV